MKTTKAFMPKAFLFLAMLLIAGSISAYAAVGASGKIAYADW